MVQDFQKAKKGFTFAVQPTYEMKFEVSDTKLKRLDKADKNSLFTILAEDLYELVMDNCLYESNSIIQRSNKSIENLRDLATRPPSLLKLRHDAIMFARNGNQSDKCIYPCRENDECIFKTVETSSWKPIKPKSKKKELVFKGENSVSVAFIEFPENPPLSLTTTSQLQYLHGYSSAITAFCESKDEAGIVQSMDPLKFVTISSFFNFDETLTANHNFKLKEYVQKSKNVPFGISFNEAGYAFMTSPNAFGNDTSSESLHIQVTKSSVVATLSGYSDRSDAIIGKSSSNRGAQISLLDSNNHISMSKQKYENVGTLMNLLKKETIDDEELVQHLIEGLATEWKGMTSLDAYYSLIAKLACGLGGSLVTNNPKLTEFCQMNEGTVGLSPKFSFTQLPTFAYLLSLTSSETRNMVTTIVKKKVNDHTLIVFSSYRKEKTTELMQPVRAMTKGLPSTDQITMQQVSDSSATLSTNSMINIPSTTKDNSSKSTDMKKCTALEASFVFSDQDSTMESDLCNMVVTGLNDDLLSSVEFHLLKSVEALSTVEFSKVLKVKWMLSSSISVGSMTLQAGDYAQVTRVNTNKDVRNPLDQTVTIEVAKSKVSCRIENFQRKIATTPLMCVIENSKPRTPTSSAKENK